MANDVSREHLTVRDRREIAAVRRRVRDVSRLASSDAAWLDAITLAVSEIVTNAIEYGAGGPVEITIEVDGGVQVAVAADSTGIPLPPAGPVPMTSVRGRGLHVVQALADQVSIDVRGGRVTVTCRFDLPI